MVRDIDLNELEREVGEILENGNVDTTVELSDLSESSYRQLAERFGDRYEVQGIINILRIGNGGRNYVLHIRRNQNA